MKTRLSIIAGLVTALVLASATVNAQIDEPAVKVLPSAQKGVFKIMYAYDTDKAVQVTFLNNDGFIGSDFIKARDSRHGFFKKYDIRNIESDIFWIEIKGNNVAVIYRMTKSDAGDYVPALEKTTYNHELVAANN